MAERYYVDMRVSGNKTDLTEFLLLCKKIEYLCNVGASREIPVSVDGDGSADIRADFKDVDFEWDKKAFEEELNKDSSGVVGRVSIGE